MSELVDRARRFVADALAAAADPDKALGMQAYMKTEMPFYGVQKPGRDPILRGLVAGFPPIDREEYQGLVLGLWDLPHREERYLALGVAQAHRRFVEPESLQLYERLIIEGAWWDFVDEVATHLIRDLVVDRPLETWPVVDGWVDHDDMWLRRSALICQVGAGDRVDASRLFDFCARRSHEREFFIRKAIGWGLRDHARTDPVAVADFVSANRERLSPLSFREATKHIGHLVPG